MKKSNRRAAWLLSLCMALGLVLPGSTAALAAADDAADGTLEFPEAGITLHLPEEFENTHGVIIPYGGFDVTGGAGIYETALLYFAMDQEAYDTYTENTNPTEEEFNNFWNSSAWLVLILSAVLLIVLGKRSAAGHSHEETFHLRTLTHTIGTIVRKTWRWKS